jgi:hypothetical protein
MKFEKFNAKAQQLPFIGASTVIKCQHDVKTKHKQMNMYLGK